MDEKVGAYKINELGEVVPDLDDPAMKERLNPEKKQEKKKNQEVKEDAGK